MRDDQREWLRGSVYSGFHPWHQAGAFEPWLEYVEEIQVELHPGGRAVLDHPDTRIPVEIRFIMDPAFLPISYKVEAPPGEHLPWVEISMSYYVAALAIALEERGERIADAPLPSAGQPPSIPFYKSLIAEYDDLLRAGHRSPVSELSVRYGAKPGTVKSWLHRGRKYVKEEKA
jgi:hypothetical protein